MRRPDRVEKQVTAHSGPVFAINWHPEDRNWLATAGRDRMIKVRFNQYPQLAGDGWTGQNDQGKV